MPINKALAEYLDLYHKGEANAVTSRELECAFRMRGSELRRTIRQLRSRIKKIAFAERGLSRTLPDYEDTGQLSLPLEGGDTS